MRKVKFADVLNQYKIYHFVDDNTEYRQVTISRHTGVSYRGTKFGRDIGRKRQFVIDLEEYPNTFIFTRQGVQDGSYGIVPQDVHNCVVTENMPMFAVQPTLNPAYLEFYLQTKHFQDQLQALNAAGSAQKSIHENTLLQLDILLPDVDVQKAIVEEIQSVKNKQEIVLTELKTQSNLITKLRSSILSDAISGRLVPQEATDESASVLLERIKVEKERLIKEGKLKRDKPLSPITANEIPYELPVGWAWCRLGEIIESLQNGLSKRDGESGPFVTVLRLADITNSKINLADTRSIRLNDNEQQKYSIHETDILITRVNGSVDIVGNFNTCISVINPLAYCDHFMRMRLFNGILPLYIALVEKTAIVRDVIKVVFKSTAGQKTVNQGHINSLLLPLPPLNEQHRIVTKIEKLMMTCDALEAEVAKSRAETDRLMQTILKEAFD